MIAEMKVKVVASETKIDEVLKKMKTLEEQTNSDSLRVAKDTPYPYTAVVIEGTGNKTGTKLKKKTMWEPLTLQHTIRCSLYHITGTKTCNFSSVCVEGQYY